MSRNKKEGDSFLLKVLELTLAKRFSGLNLLFITKNHRMKLLQLFSLGQLVLCSLPNIRAMLLILASYEVILRYNSSCNIVSDVLTLSQFSFIGREFLRLFAR